MKGNFVWDLPDIRSDRPAFKAIGLLVNDWRLSSIWTGRTGSPYSVGYSYQSGFGNQNVTGSQDYGGRVRIVGDPGRGCSSDPYRQFNPAAFEGPPPNSVGLESRNDYLRECFLSTLDLLIARTIRLGGARSLQLRVDLFNAPNSAIITGRASTINLTNPNDPSRQRTCRSIRPASLPARLIPRSAGVGVANEFQNPRRVQIQARFSF